jgi:hypothetical protein
VAGVAGEDTGRVHTEEEADGRWRRGKGAGAMIRSGNCPVSLPGPRRAVAIVTLSFVQRKIVHFVGALVAQAVLIVARSVFGGVPCRHVVPGITDGT